MEFKAWLTALTDIPARDAITARILRVQSGLLGDHRSVGKKVSELRVDVGPGYRLYYTKRGLRLILLLCGGDKSRQDNDIGHAQAMVKMMDRDQKDASTAAGKRKK